ncbi:MAG: hypothetical protein JO276_08775 [Sphingomonadaceae bacterium]|nr:hypothetical protein [Sphingomonadaceae bacterium]
MAQAKAGRRRLRWLALAAAVLTSACGGPPQHAAAENEFNAWADQVEHESANGQANAPVDLEEPRNVLDRVTPANTR